MKGLRPALVRFIVLAFSALALQGLPLLYLLMAGKAGQALYQIHLYVLLPLSAILLPLWAGKGGVHPFAAFFPIGGAMLLIPVYHRPGMGLICLLLSLIAAAAGQEWQKRQQSMKGRNHGKGKS